MTKVNKELESNVRNLLREVTQGQSGWLRDYDPDLGIAIYEIDDYSDGKYTTAYFQYSYTISDNKVTMSEERKEVVFKTIVEDVAVTSEESTLDKILKAIGDLAGGSKKEVAPVETNVLKQFNEEERIAYEPLYSAPDVADGAGDGMTEGEIVKMVDNLNGHIKSGKRLENLGHKVPITKGQWEYTEAFCSPWPECQVGDQTIMKGHPVLVVKYHNERAWELRKEGKIKGPSIGAKGKRVEVAE